MIKSIKKKTLKIIQMHIEKTEVRQLHNHQKSQRKKRKKKGRGEIKATKLIMDTKEEIKQRRALTNTCWHGTR